MTPTRGLARSVTWIACGAVVGAASIGRAQSEPSIRPLEYSRMALPNGLVALLNEDHSSPIVAVDVWYHIGAKDESPGRIGFAHLCEHLMGEGSPNLPQPERVFIQSIGGTSTRWANTTEDITHYYYTLPAHQLETALWVESDRMAAPLSRADAAHFGQVREVVRQERVQSREGPVLGLAGAQTLAGLFSADDPYRNDPLGPMTDLDASTAGDVKAFCLPYYVPNNAVIALSGDFASAHMKTLIEKYFGDIARGRVPSRRPLPASGPSTATRIVLEDSRARGATLRLAWPSVGFADPDRLPLVALASLLSRDRTGVLSKLLVYDRALATRVAASNFDFERGGLFQLDVFPRADASLSAIEALVDSALASFSAESIRPEELDALKRANAVAAITNLQTRAARADTLAHGELFAGDPVAYAKQVDAMSKVTAAGIERVARRYLAGARIVMSMIPAGRLDLISQPEKPYTRIQMPGAKP